MVCDDDSSIKAKLKWSNEDCMNNNNTTEVPKIINSNGNTVERPNYGGIPGHMPEPSFKADPNHRRKILTNKLCNLAPKNKTSPEERHKQLEKKRLKVEEEAKKKGKDPPIFKEEVKQHDWNLTMTKMDVRRLSKNFGFMIRTLKNKTTDEEMLDTAEAVLEHHFGNHKRCGVFCRRKIELEEGNLDEGKFYRDKKKDELLYNKLKSIIARFITLDASKEVAHSLDTCANESFNNAMAWVAPKNKVHAGSHSLKNRMSVAIGTKTLGINSCYHGLFEKLGIKLTPDISHYLAVKSNVRQKRIVETKTTECKKKRKAGEYRRLKDDTTEAKKARAKRDGSVYKPGIGMTGGYDNENVEQEANVDTTKTCSKCKQPGHLRPSNKLCQHYVPRNRQKKKSVPVAEDVLVTPVNEEEAMAAEMDEMDVLPL